MSSKDAGSRGAVQGKGRMWAWLRGTTPSQVIRKVPPHLKNGDLLKFAKDCFLVFFP